MKSPSQLSRTQKRDAKLSKDVVLQQAFQNTQVINQKISDSKKQLGSNPIIHGKNSNAQKRKRSRALMREMKNARFQAGIDDDIDLTQFSQLFKKYHCSLLEAGLLFLYDMHKCRSIPDALAACAHLLKHTFRKNLSEYAKVILDYFKETIVPSLLGHFQAGEDLPGEEFVMSMNTFFETVEGCGDSKVFNVLRDFLLYVWCFVFDLIPLNENSSQVFKLIQEQITLKKIEPDWNVATKLIRSLFYLTGQGYQSVKSGCLMTFFHTNTTFSRWIKQVYEVPLTVSNLNSADPLKRVTQTDFVKNLDTLIQQGVEMKSLVKGIENSILAKELVKLRLLRNEQFNDMIAMKTRAAPLALLVSAAPDQGKSSFLKILHSFFAQKKGLERGDESRYVRNFHEEYWSNFKSTMWCIVLDDIANESMNMVSCLADSSVGEILQIINNIAYVPNMARLEDKGKCPCLAQLVIATTNTPGLNASHMYNNPYAILRRFPVLITLVVKEYFRKTCGGLDSTKVESGLMNVWIIEVRKPLPSDSRQPKYTRPEKFEGIHGFLCWFNHTIEFHDEIQRKIVANVSDMDRLIFCTDCFGDSNICRCNVPVFPEVEVQVGVEEVYGLFNTSGMSSALVEPMYDYGDQEWTEGDLMVRFNILTQQYSHYFKETSSYWGIKFFQTMILKVIVLIFTAFLSWPLFIGLLVPLCVYHQYTIGQARQHLVGSFALWIYQYLPLRVKIWIFNRMADGVFNRVYEHNVHRIRTTTAVLSALLAIGGAYSTYLWAIDFKTNVDTLVEESKQLGKVVEEPVVVEEKPEVEEVPVTEDIDPIITDEVLPGEVSGFAEMQGGILAAPIDNPYYNDVDVSVSYDFGRKVSSWKDLGRDVILGKLYENVVSIRAKDDGMKRTFGSGIYIGDQVVMTNYHLFHGHKRFVVAYSTGGVCKCSVELTVANSDVVECREVDLMFIRFRQLPAHRNIMSLFPVNDLKDLNCMGTMISRNREGMIVCRPDARIAYGWRRSLYYKELDETFENATYRLGFTNTIDGDCGSIYVAWTPRGPTIVALHQFLCDCAYGTAVSYDKMQCAINTLGSRMQGGTIEAAVETLGVNIQGGSVIRPTLPYDLEPFSKHSNIRRIPDISGYVFGSTLHRFPSKSKVRRTKIYESVVESGIVDIYSGPDMHSREVWINQITPVLCKNFLLDLDLMDAARDMFVTEVNCKLGEKDLEKVHILTDFASVNGEEGVKFIDKIVRNTSAGFPLNKSKKHFFVLEDGNAIVDESIWADVHEMYEGYKRGERAMVIFMGALKDEILTKKKVAAKKTRMFTGSPFSFTILFRKYFLSITALMQNNTQLFESYVGVNAMGPDWENLYKYLTHFGVKRMCAGDYQAFDKNMSAAVILAAFDILIDIAHRSGFSSEDLLVMKTMAHDIAFPILNVDGDIVMAYGMNPSGHPLTVIINCLVNCIYLRMAFIKHNPNKMFKDYVHLATYGDDNIFGVSDDCNFSHTILSDFLNTQGIVYTMADKTSVSIPFVDISDTTFLKRSFVFDTDLHHIVPPLETASMDRTLLHYIPSQAICGDAQLVEKMDMVSQEYFFHGKETFEEKRIWLLSLLDKHDLRSFVEDNCFGSWDFLAARFLDKFEPRMQGGCCTLEEAICYICGKEDCPFFGLSQTVCPRCRRCRSQEIVEDDIHFLGCIYCESDFPMQCDMCEGNVINHRVRLDLMHNLFYCDWCYDRINTKARSDDIAYIQSNRPYWCDLSVNVSKTEQLPVGGSPYSIDVDMPLDTDPTPQTGTSAESTKCSTNNNVIVGLPTNMACDLPKVTREKWNSSQFQAGEDDSADVVGDVIQTQEVATFMDASAPAASNMPSTNEEIPYQVTNRNSALGDFLSRPVKIASFTWSTTDVITDVSEFEPYHLYLNNSFIKYKLHNWAHIKTDLKLKLVFNASPFLYGTMMMSWMPLHNSHYGEVVFDDGAGSHRITMSQLQKVLICPQSTQSVEMELPYLYPYDFILMDDEDTLKTVGTLRADILAPLQSANGDAGAITISIYAWTENAILHGATSKLAMQAGIDEYAMDGPVSKPATAIASLAGNFSKIPYIGPFATATSIGATAVAHIAKLFGYTNTPVIDDQHAVEPRAYPFMSVSDVGFPIDKLSLDSKNELTIDSRCCGLDGSDELALTNLVTKESFLCSFDWATTDDEDDLLFSSAVHPQLYVSTDDTQFHIYMPPMCWLATMFNYWRGDIVFRFKVNCSRFHRGRMRITFDPLGTATTESDSQMTCFNQIVDVTPDTDIEVRVPYQQHRAWCSNTFALSLTESAQKHAVASNNHVSGSTNGTISCRVQTALTAPAADSTVSILVFVRGAENLEFASPDTELYRNVSIGGTMQAGVDMRENAITTETAPRDNCVLGEVERPIDHLYLTYMGEQICSVRPLLRRMCKTFSIRLNPVSLQDSTGFCNHMRIPPRFGFGAYGFHVVQGVVDDESSFPFNWCQPTYLAIIAPCFLGNRGSIHWTQSYNSGDASTRDITVMRNNHAANIDYGKTSSTPLNNVDAADRYRYTDNYSTGTGGLLQNMRTACGVNYSVPYYSTCKFAPNNIDSGTNTASNNGISEGVRTEVAVTQSTAGARFEVTFYTGAGTDFNLIKFMFVPTMTVYTTLPSKPD